jgi:hypothetical protein
MHRGHRRVSGVGQGSVSSCPCEVPAVGQVVRILHVRVYDQDISHRL